MSAQPDRFEGAGGAEPELCADPRWYACYTRARHEKKVEQALEQRGVDSYLPLFGRESQWKDRRKVVEWPLFPGYVFARFDLRDVHRVLTIPGVSTIVRSGGRLVPIPDRELENVRRFVEALARTGQEPELRPLLDEGQRVKVVDGPMEGVEAVVIERRGRNRVLVGLEAIGQGLEVDIDTRLLAPVGRRQSA